MFMSTRRGTVVKKELMDLVHSVEVKIGDFEQMLWLRRELEPLLLKRQVLIGSREVILVELAEVEEKIAIVTKQAESRRKPATKKKAVKKVPAKKKPVAKKVAAKKKAVKKAKQPTIADLIVEVLKEKGKPMSPKAISTALLKEKKFKTQSKNFPVQIGVLLAQDKGKRFKKATPGMYTLP